MTEIERLGLVIGLTALVLVITAVARRRPRVRERSVDATGLDPGFYLLTSEECGACSRARERLASAGVEYEEMSWQARPDVFTDLGIDAVPSLIAVDPTKHGRWWRGGVPRQSLLQSLINEMPRTGAEGG